MANRYEPIAKSYRPRRENATEIPVWIFDEDGAGEEVDWRGGPATLITDASSTLGGGQIQMKWSGDGGKTFGNVGDVIMLASQPGQELNVSQGKLKPVLSGSTLGGAELTLTLA